MAGDMRRERRPPWWLMYATVAVLSVRTSTCLSCSSVLKQRRASQTASNSRQLICHCSWGPCPSRDPVVKPTLKQSHMKKSERRDSGWGCHMPQEPLKVFQWNRPLALESIRELIGPERRGLPLQAAAPCGQSCMAIACSPGGISTYPWAAPPLRVVRTEEALGLFWTEKGALQNLVTSSCTSGKKGTGDGCWQSACAPRNQIVQP